jgi:prepilin-type N-terminal cleavage/methylation domain-containing protein
MTKKRRSGFTLIELILVLAILAILAAIAQANFALILENSRYKADVLTAKNIIKATRLQHLSMGLSPEDNVGRNGLTEQYLSSTDVELQSNHIESYYSSRYGTIRAPYGKFMLLQFSEGKFVSGKYVRENFYGVMWITRPTREGYLGGKIVMENDEQIYNVSDVYWRDNAPSSLWTDKQSDYGYNISYSGSTASQMYYYIFLQVIE